MGFMRNMLYFANVEMLMSIWLVYGFNPTLKEGLQPDRFTDDENIQKYFTGEHEGTDEQALQQIRESLRDVIDPDVKKLNNVYDTLGWSHLYTKHGRLREYNKLIVALWVYVWDKVTIFVKVEKEHGNTIALDTFTKQNLYFWRKKFRKVVGGETSTLRQNLEAATTTPGTEGDNFVRVELEDYKSVSTNECKTFTAVVDSLFEPLVKNNVQTDTKLNLTMTKREATRAKGSEKRKKKGSEEDANQLRRNKQKIDPQNKKEGTKDDESTSKAAKSPSNNTVSTQTTAVSELMDDVARRYVTGTDKQVLLVLQEIVSSGEDGKYKDLYEMMSQTETECDKDTDFEAVEEEK